MWVCIKMNIVKPESQMRNEQERSKPRSVNQPTGRLRSWRKEAAGPNWTNWTEPVQELVGPVTNPAPSRDRVGLGCNRKKKGSGAGKRRLLRRQLRSGLTRKRVITTTGAVINSVTVAFDRKKARKPMARGIIARTFRCHCRRLRPPSIDSELPG